MPTFSKKPPPVRSRPVVAHLDEPARRRFAHDPAIRGVEESHRQGEAASDLAA